MHSMCSMCSNLKGDETMKCNCFSKYFGYVIQGLQNAHMNLPFAYRQHDEVRGQILDLMDHINSTFHCVDPEGCSQRLSE